MLEFVVISRSLHTGIAFVSSSHNVVARFDCKESSCGMKRVPFRRSRAHRKEPIQLLGAASWIEAFGHPKTKIAEVSCFLIVGKAQDFAVVLGSIR